MTVQQLLEPEEIVSRSAGQSAVLRLPVAGELFSRRAARLAELAPGHPLEGYLRLVGEIAAAQHELLRDAAAGRLPGEQDLARAHEHRMPPLAVQSWSRDPVWRDILDGLCARLEGRLPAAAGAVLGRVARSDADWRENQAGLILNGLELGLDKGAAVFIAAALQVYWTRMAAALGPGAFPRLDVAGVCPCCGSRPLASVMRPGGEGVHRYLACSLCAAEWYLVRIKCPSREATERLGYCSGEGGPGVVKAEACDDCHTYMKLFQADKDWALEPCADDLASMALDLLMAEGDKPHLRAGINLALFHGDDGARAEPPPGGGG